MKKTFFAVLLLASVACLFAASPAFAPLVLTTNDSQSGSSNESASQDTSAVDLSDKDTSQTTWSPSFENTTPSGQASGGPVEEN